MDERLIKKIERQYAYFHRVLSGLLVDLAAQPETVWLSGREHSLAKNYQDNRYERALYPVQDLGLFAERFAELAAVQTEAVAILGVKKVPIGLLTPQVLDDVHFARLTRQDNYRVKWLSKAEVLGRYQGKLNQALAAFEAFRSQSWGLGDQGLKTVENEVRTLEHGLRRLEACDDDGSVKLFRFRGSGCNYMPRNASVCNSKAMKSRFKGTAYTGDILGKVDFANNLTEPRVTLP